MLKARFAPVVFGVPLSGLLSLIVSGVTTVRVRRMLANFLELWLQAWRASWRPAVPVVLVVAPVTRRIVDRRVRS